MSDLRVRVFAAIVVLVSVVTLPGCSGKSPITITLTPSGQASCGTNTNSGCAVTINQGASISISASVANDSTNGGVTWTLGSSVGTLNSQTTTSVTYVAPAALTANTTATVTATSVANTSVTAAVTITVDAVFQFESASLPFATVGAPYNGVITTEGATGPFTWAIISGTLPAGVQLSNSDTASVNITGTPTTSGTATFTVQATDGAGTPISKTFTITVNPPPSLTITTTSLPNGAVGTTYPNASTPSGYQLTAAYGTAPYTWSIVGSGSLPAGLTLSSSGLISGTPTTAGTSTFTVQVQDSATPNPGIATRNLTLTITQTLINSQLSGNYAFLVNGFDPSGKRFVAGGSFTASGGGAITNASIDTNDAGTVQSLSSLSGTYSIAATGVGTLSFAGRTFALSFVPTGGTSAITSANFIEFDNLAQAAGMLLQQTTPFSTPSGGYAFGFIGNDASNQRYGVAGSFTASVGGAGTLDSDDAGVLQSNASFTVSALGTPNATSGRGTFAFSVGSSATNYAYYVVNSTEAFAVEIDANATIAGTMLAQSGSLGASSLTAAVFETTALSSGAALSQLGVMNGSGGPGTSGTLSTSFDQSSGGTTITSSGTYNVPSSRVTLSGSGLQTSSDPVLYLAQPNEGFLVGTDSAVTFGYIKAQTTATPSGIFAGGSIAPTLSGPSGEVDAADASSGTLSFTYDASTNGGLLQNQTSGTAYTSPVTNGRGTIQSMPQGSPAIYYVVSSTEFWVLPVNGNGTIYMFQQ